MAISTFDVTCEKKTLKKIEQMSPYLAGDKVQLQSRLTEKKFIKKKEKLDFVSSFPLAANIYKANSDKSLKKPIRKIKKSVLTLPNQPVPSPQICTVSDMNDSEYYSQSNSNNNKPRLKKRSGIKNVRKPPLENKGLYDRDKRYCSKFNFDLDSSSTEIMKPYKGDGRKISKHFLQKGSRFSSISTKTNDQFKPHDVWAVLRSLNRFPFQPSLPMSDDSVIGVKKKKAPKKRVNCKDTRVYETKEFAYISSYEVDSRSVSQSSSFDRVTVINKQDEFSKMCEEFKNGFLKSNILKHSDANKNIIDVKNKPKKRFFKKRKSLAPSVHKENEMKLMPLNHSDSVINQNESEYDKDNCSSIEDDANSSLTKMGNTTNKNIKNVEYSLVPAEESFIRTDNAGSSKAELTTIDSNKLKENNMYGRPSQTNKISRINFSKPYEPASRMSFGGSEKQKIKPRLVTTMPSACMMPKLTQTDIRRRLALLRFPIVILGKDQVNATVEVPDYDPPQFNGLDKHIWPYMKNWNEKGQLKSKDVVVKKQAVVTHYIGQSINKHDIDPVLNAKRATKICNEVLTNENDRKRTLRGNTNYKREETKHHTKSIAHLKDKMLNFLFKKITNTQTVADDYRNMAINPPYDNEPEVITPKQPLTVDASTEMNKEIQIKSTWKHRDSVSPRSTTRSRKSPVKSAQPKTHQNKPGHQWAQAKSANEFIENVIKKIKTGIYYNPEHKLINKCTTNNRATDIEMQTEVTMDSDALDNIDMSPRVTIIKKHNTLPGFESSLPGLEIKTMNMNQISVKHSVTNIMMQFDVTVPSKQNNMPINTNMLPLAPVEVTESHTKIFKCRTTILNAMLPAELCSILPKLMRLIDTDIKSIRPGFCSSLINKAQSHLSPISELSVRATTAFVIATKSLITPVKPLSAAVNRYINGMFYTNAIEKNTTIVNPVIKYNSALFMETMIKLPCMDILQYRINILQLKECKLGVACQSETVCMALELYTMENKRLVPAFKPYNFESTVREILIKVLLTRYNRVTNRSPSKPIQCKYSLNRPSDHKSETNTTVALNNLEMDDKPVVKDTPGKRVEYIKRSSKCRSEIKGPHSATEIKVFNNKTKRNGFYKLYRKCKSATIITNLEKCVNTPLKGIQKLDDFFQALGSKRNLASVFDGYAEKKILSSIIEMKNWTTDINPKQALLILLLTNKKDTPNLVRFRPILLQGIAVNRITRATELDMEIEVIEKENMNKLKEYEGISYLPASVENHDQLLEELCWIAKTTASDYQKPFDDSSEKLLKSLLEKRKKLNPSYLRVMARYVGLGLLKHPTKK